MHLLFFGRHSMMNYEEENLKCAMLCILVRQKVLPYLTILFGRKQFVCFN